MTCCEGCAWGVRAWVRWVGGRQARRRRRGGGAARQHRPAAALRRGLGVPCPSQRPPYTRGTCGSGSALAASGRGRASSTGGRTASPPAPTPAARGAGRGWGRAGRACSQCAAGRAALAARRVRAAALPCMAAHSHALGRGPALPCRGTHVVADVAGEEDVIVLLHKLGPCARAAAQPALVQLAALVLRARGWCAVGGRV